jgi:histidinol-phosphate aminotransferase
LRATLRNLGYDVTESSTHFFLVRVESATRTKQVLLEQANVLVRDCSSFGLPDRIRIAARTPHENDILIDALHRLTALLRP